MASHTNLQLFGTIGLVFGPLAGIMAFLITHEEYSHHRLPGNKDLVMSLQAGVVGFVAILIILLLAGFLMDVLFG